MPVPDHVPVPDDISAREPVDVLRYARGFRERWWLFLLVFVVAGGGVFTFLMLQPPVYRAAAEVKILRQPEAFTQFSPLVDKTLRSVEDINTVVAEFQSELFIQRVAERVRRTNHDRFLAPYWQPGHGDEPPRLERLLLDHRDVRPGRNHLLTAITYDHPRPDVAAEVANYFVEEITAYEAETQADAAQRAVRELRVQAEAQRRRIEGLEKDIVDFKERNDSVSFDRKSDIDGQELLFLTNSLSQDERELALAAGRVELLDQLIATGRSAWESPALADHPRIGQLLLTVATRRTELARLAAVFRAPHPKMIEAREGLAAAEAELQTLVDAEVRTTRNRHAEAAASVRDSAAKLTAKKQSIIALHRLQAVYDSMQRDLETSRQTYLALHQRVQESEAQARSGGLNVRVMLSATPPVRAYRPHPVLSAGLEIAAGGGVAFATVLFSLVAAPRIKTRRDVLRELATPVLATLERLPGRETLAPRLAALALRTASTCETLSALAAHLRLAPHTARARTVLVTSTLAGEGKSFVAAALGASFARLGERVVILGADLRAPARATPPAGTGTLRELPGDAADGFARFVARDETTGLDCVYPGGRHENPYALFHAPGFARLLEFLRAQYDRVIIDTPPLAHFGDALALVPFTDVALFVVRFNHVPVTLGQRAIASLRETAVPLAGCVVNGARPLDLRLYYAGYYKDPAAARYASGVKPTASVPR